MPDLSSEVEFFDMLYLGVFAILSPAFDRRNYDGNTPPATLLSEISHAVDHFNAILLKFRWRFIILLRGLPVDVFYVVDRFLAEFAAAAVVFANAVGDGSEDGRLGDDKVEITPLEFGAKIEGILRRSRPKAHFHYSRCVLRGHSRFTWTGPDPQILPRSEELEAILTLSTRGETLDHPVEPIYVVELNETPPPPPAAAGVLGKRGVPEGGEGRGEAKKQKPKS